MLEGGVNGRRREKMQRGMSDLLYSSFAIERKMQWEMDGIGSDGR
jgi:hypothetical protein